MWSCQPRQAALSLPTLSGIEIDGERGDWQGLGLTGMLTADPWGETDSCSLTAQVWLACDSAGILLALEVRDDSLVTLSGPLWQQDGLEIFISPQAGGKDLQQWVLSPGLTSTYPEARAQYIDYRTGDIQDVSTRMPLAGQRTEAGYRLECRLPYDLLGEAYGPEATFALSLTLNDSDSGKAVVAHPLHYYPNTYRNRDAMFVFAPGPGRAQPLLITRAYLLDGHTYCFQFMGAGAAGKRIHLRQADVHWRTEPTQPWDRDTYQATFTLPVTEVVSRLDSLSVWVGNRYQYTLSLADIPRRYEETEVPHPFEEDIRLFEKRDHETMPPSCGTLFIGSSSIRLWETLPEDFPELEIIQRGFGGSTTEDVLHFYERIVVPYEPQTIVFFAGVNDIAKGLLPQEVVANTEQFVQQIGRDLPGTEVYILSHTISVSRKRLAPSYRRTNTLLARMLRRYPYARLVDVTTPTLDARGRPQGRLFRADSTHLNARGYAVWTETLRPLLIPPAAIDSLPSAR